MGWTFEKVTSGYQGRIGGVVWDGTNVLFSVPEENNIFKLAPGSSKAELIRHHTNHVTGLDAAADGRMFACQEGSRRIIQLHDDGSASKLSFKIDGLVHNHPCDVAIDSKNRVWFCDCHSTLLYPGPKIWPVLDHCSVLRQDQNPQLQSKTWTISRMTHDTRNPRAVILSADEKTLFVAESDNKPDGKRELRAYPIREEGYLDNPAVLQTFGSDHRGPHRGIEGMCLDSEGNIIACAGWQRSGPGPVVMVIAPSGAVLETWNVPDNQPTRCTFGDAGLKSLYVGTAGGNLYRISNTGRSGHPRA
jgi:gluconolactonase